MKKAINPVLAVGCGLLAMVLVYSGDTFAQGIRQGIQLCLQTVIPSLFCFMILTSFLMQSGLYRLLSLPLGPFCKTLLYLPSEMGSVVLLSLICGYGFLKENWRVFFPWKPVSMQWEVTNIDSVRPLLDEYGEFQIGMDGTVEAKLPEHCPAGSDPIQVGRLPESEAWRKQFTLDPNALMEYGNRCHVYSFVLSFDGTTATLYSTDSQ